MAERETELLWLRCEPGIEAIADFGDFFFHLGGGNVGLRQISGAGECFEVRGSLCGGARAQGGGGALQAVGRHGQRAGILRGERDGEAGNFRRSILEKYADDFAEQSFVSADNAAKPGDVGWVRHRGRRGRRGSGSRSGCCRGGRGLIAR